MWESIPERLRAIGPEEVGRRLEDFDWSHIRPHSQGGGNEASNGIFEFASLNRSRGAEQMTEAAGQAGVAWVLQLFNGATLEAARPETTPQPFVGPPELVGPIVVVPGWIHAYQPGFNPPGAYGMFPGVAGTGERF